MRGGFLLSMIIAAAAIVELPGCQSESGLASQENDLAAAGFEVKIANTAERLVMLDRLPPNQFVVRTHGDVTHYVYADPGCGCLYVGNRRAFEKYLSNQRLDAANSIRQTIQDFDDPAWNWAEWGPWGPLGPEYGPGVGGW
jgi:hypothetical protein